MPSKVRVRFAPSPTGDPHIGNIRTAIFNWLFARHHGGSFIIRIEDTDRSRFVPSSINTIQENLKWLGIQWDEGLGKCGDYGPYTQSERLDIYRPYAEELINKGWAYRCNCSAERLQVLREQQIASGQPPRYDGHCRSSSVSSEESHVIRLRVPSTGFTEFDDLVRGHLKFENSVIDDQVLIKSDGFPTYHMAAVVDDHLMEISHVIRGEDWISSTPKHLLLYQALGWQAPKYAHLPNIMGEDGKKLSKRHGATSVTEFRKDGYLPEAVLNFLVLLGWSVGRGSTQEIFTSTELISLFDLDGVSRSSPKFQYDKLNWINATYLRSLSEDEFLQLLVTYYNYVGIEVNLKQIDLISSELQTRIQRLDEILPLIDFLLKDEIELSKEILTLGKKTDQELSNYIAKTYTTLDQEIIDWSKDTLEKSLHDQMEAFGEKPKVYFNLIRTVITGQKVSPPLVASIAALGKKKTLRRLEQALKVLT